jgi:hypothetical protein
VDLDRVAEDRLLEVEFEFVAQVGAAEYLRPAATSTTEDVAEDVAENVAEGVTRIETGATATTHAVHARVAELVVGRALLRIGERLVGLLGLLELVLGLVVARVAVRVELHGEAPIRLLDVGLRRRARHVEDLVVIALRHAMCGGVSGAGLLM